MTAHEVFGQLRGRGVRIEARGFDVWLSAPVPDPLLTEVRARKPELNFHALEDELARLRRCAIGPERTARLAELEGLERWYRDHGLFTWYAEGWLLLRSDLLDEPLVIVRDDRVEVPESVRKLTRYSLDEVERLAKAEEAGIRAAHRVKTIFKGHVTEVSALRACDGAPQESEEGSMETETILDGRRLDGADVLSGVAHEL